MIIKIDSVFSIFDLDNESGSGVFGPYLKIYLFELHEWRLKLKVWSRATIRLVTSKCSDVYMRTLWLKYWKSYSFSPVALSRHIWQETDLHQPLDLFSTYISSTGCCVIRCVWSALCSIIYIFPLYVSISSKTYISVNRCLISMIEGLNERSWDALHFILPNLSCMDNHSGSRYPDSRQHFHLSISLSLLQLERCTSLMKMCDGSMCSCCQALHFVHW